MVANTRRVLSLLLCIAALCAPAAASAFTFESAFSDGCHERITAAALAEAGWPGGVIAPEPDKATRVLEDNLIFDPPDGLDDHWALSLLIGVRYNDLQGNRPTELDELAGHHNGNEGQRQHCLRTTDHNGREGDEAALADCRAFILEQVEKALGDADTLDLAATVPIEFSMRYERTQVDLNRYAFRVGRALHAVQDSYSHSLRDPDDPRVILTLFNYIEPAFDSGYDRAVDGVAHAARFDSCSVDNELRLREARNASAELLAALADPTGGRQGRLDRARAFLDANLSLSPTPCTEDNRFCGAFDDNGDLIPALEVPDDATGCGCRTTSPTSGTPSRSGVLLALTGLAMLTLVRRRRARTRRAPLATTLPLVTLLALTLSPQLAVAQPTPDPTPPPTDEVPAPVDTPDVQEGDETEDGRLFGEPVEVEDDVDEAVREGKPLEEVIAGPYSVQVVAGASLDNGALFGRVGFGWEVTPEVMLGLVAEFNPWYSLDRLAFSLGAFNGYATVGYRWLETELVALHSALGLGVSTLLFDVVSTPAGTVGPFVSLEPVAITIFPRDRLRVLINAGEFAMPAPGIEGTPFLYRQYRVAFGIQYNP